MNELAARSYIECQIIYETIDVCVCVLVSFWKQRRGTCKSTCGSSSPHRIHTHSQRTISIIIRHWTNANGKAVFQTRPSPRTLCLLHPFEKSELMFYACVHIGDNNNAERTNALPNGNDKECRKKYEKLWWRIWTIVVHLRMNCYDGIQNGVTHHLNWVTTFSALRILSHDPERMACDYNKMVKTNSKSFIHVFFVQTKFEIIFNFFRFLFLCRIERKLVGKIARTGVIEVQKKGNSKYTTKRRYKGSYWSWIFYFLL